MVTVFVICWGPYAAQSLAGVFGFVSCFVILSHCTAISLSLSSQNVPVALSVFPLQFAKLSVLANPVIYVVMNKAVSLYICITVH